MLGACTVLEPVLVPIGDAVGRVAVDALVATESVPPFANSAVDGFAVRAADTRGAAGAAPVRFKVVGTHPRRHGSRGRARPAGEAVRIMTGAAVPRGADAIVMVEDSRPFGDAEVDLAREVEPGQAVRAAGDDLRPGDAVFPARRRADGRPPRRAGHVRRRRRCAWCRRPRVGVLSTGDELVEGPQPLAPGQIRDSNRRTLLALVAQSGAVGVDLGRIGDDEDAIADVILRGVATCDALITSGGVSMGDYDFVKIVLDRLGDMRWMQVAIKPGQAAGLRHGGA